MELMYVIAVFILFCLFDKNMVLQEISDSNFTGFPNNSSVSAVH